MALHHRQPLRRADLGIEIELTAKHADRTAAIMTGLSAPAGYTHVYYLTAPPRAAS